MQRSLTRIFPGAPLYFCFLLLSLAQPLAAQSVTRPETAALTDTTVQLPSGRIFYRDSGGSGAPVIFLHAGSGNSMLWEYQIPAFTTAGYRFIAIDYRGVDTAQGIAIPVASTRISELVTLLALDRFHLVGTAAGGGTALQYALAYQDQLRSITVTNSIGNVQDKQYTEMGRRIRPPEFNQLPLELRELGPSYRALNPEGVKHWLALSGEERVSAGIVTAPVAPANSSSAEGPDPNAVTWAKLETLMVPTLLITGAADLYTPPSVLRLFADHLRQAESHVIVESGHSAYWENPDEFNAIVLEFINRH